MATPRRIGPPPTRSTPPEPAGWRGHERALPPDLLRQASARLGVMSLLGAALWTAAPALGHVAGDVPFPQALDAVAGASIVLSLALFVYTRRSRGSPERALDLGLWYMVLTALALGMSAHLSPLVPVSARVHWTPESEISWAGVVILMFAAIIPSTPAKTLVAGLAAASMNPIAMLIGLALGMRQFGPPINALWMHYPDYLLVGVAVAISHVVTQLGRQVARAREMGSYEIGELVGRGGMGEVYRATHRMLARPAAIKLIRPEMLGDGDDGDAQVVAQRFRREAAAAANLRSPHTVEVYDFGVTEDGTLYYVMELLEGMDLESLVRRHGPMPAGRVIHVLRQVCDSLAEAHARGMVHRDIKPSNIHIGCIGLQRDFVKVLDFGLVQTAARADGEQSLVTLAGTAIGTPAYMAPEMLFGETIDWRADLYALGCVAYYLLTGALVFEAENGLQMVARHLQAEPIPPSQRTTQPIPPPLERLVLSCLAKDPRNRPQSAGEIARALAAIEAASWSEEQAVRWWSANAGAAGERVVTAG